MTVTENSPTHYSWREHVFSGKRWRLVETLLTDGALKTVKFQGTRCYLRTLSTAKTR